MRGPLPGWGRALGLATGLVALAGCPTDELEPPDVSAWTPTTPTGLWPAESGAPIRLSSDLAALDWLQDVSAYGQDGLPDGRAHAGTYGVGNGVVFGLVGLDDPWNTVTNLIGPGYQRSGGFYGDIEFLLQRDGVLLEADAERVQRPRRSAVVRSLWEADGVQLITTDLAPAGARHVLRHIAVHTPDGAGAGELALRVTLARADGELDPADPRGLRQTRGDRELLIHCPGEDVDVADGTLTLALPALVPGDEWTTTCLLETSSDGAFSDTIPTPAADALAAHHDALDAWFDAGVQLELPDPKVEDLVEGMLVTHLVQTSEMGVVSPMNRYTTGWLRDTEGPTRLMLRTGHPDDVRTMLDATYQALVVHGAIKNSFGLDTDLSQFEEPADPDAFWASADFMPGRNAAEAPSYPVLLHDLYVRRTGDTSILAGGRMAFLDACLRRQEISADGLLPFSGDETFRFAMATAIGAELPEEAGWSANSSFLFAAAADRLLMLGGDPSLGALADEVRIAAEAHYWVEPDGYYAPIEFFDSGEVFPAPFEDVSTQPLWTGYAPPTDPRQRDNVDRMVAHLMREDGVFLSPLPDSDLDNYAFTGMVPGFALRNLALVDDDDAPVAFAAVDLVATPSGHFEEGHRPDLAAFHLAHEADGMGSDAVARYRPWEGGDTVAAVLAYLIGDDVDATTGSLHLAPHLPRGWPSLEAHGLQLGDARFDLRYEAYEEGQRLWLERHDASSTHWFLDLELQGDAPITEVWIDGGLALFGAYPELHLDDWQLQADTLEVIVVYDDG